MIDLRLGDCLEVMRTLPDASIDCVITDPPYPEIDRPYGRMSEADWWEMMMGVCTETRRLLKPSGSAVFILQPNSRKVGSIRGWLWEFMAWVCRDWNMVQDAWWWNLKALPMSGCTQHELLRSSIKTCVWAGAANCYRNQANVRWSPSDELITRHQATRAGIQNSPSGASIVYGRMDGAYIRNGGVTPFNLLPIPGVSEEESKGHSAQTPLELAKWWMRYICPSGGIVLDPFVGSGTMMLAAIHYGYNGIGIERDPTYYAIAEKRIDEAQWQLPLLEVA